MDARLLEIIACPNCKGKLLYDQQDQLLLCRYDKTVYRIHEGVPVLIVNQAQCLNKGGGL